MNNSLKIRNAKTQEAENISELAMRSKAFWGYSEAFMEACREELTVTADNLATGHIRYMVAEQDSKLLGYYAIEKRTENEYELEALFVEPAHIGTGIGKTLMDHAKSTVKELGGKKLVIQGDPNADKFYRAAGGRPIGMRKSASISGRNLPLFIIEITSETVT